MSGATFYAGFDSYDCPSPALLEWLDMSTNLYWAGYYLGPTPAHTGTSWMGQREAIQDLMFGILPIYVGQQTTGPGSVPGNPSVTPAQGTTDGTQAATLMQSEGFVANSYVYLDVEGGPPLNPAHPGYIAAWAAAVIAGGYRPGVYCSHWFAAQIQSLVPAARIWGVKVPSVDLHTDNPPVVDSVLQFPAPDPAGCGFAGSYAWQREEEAQLTVPANLGGTFTVDLSTCKSADPGAPD